MGQLPYNGIRVIELSKTIAGRLAGLLFADQGAEVLIERTSDFKPGEQDEYFDRNKIALIPGNLSNTESADVIIVDGERKADRLSSQIVLRIVAALPGDETYGDLEHDCSEDLLNALVGFYTNMSLTGPILGRPVIYTPLPLCSVYTGVIGSVAVGAALVDREHCGRGREVTASRIAGGLSAIGAFTLTSKGLPDHIVPSNLDVLKEMPPEKLESTAKEAIKNPKKQLWLEQRLLPLCASYYASDERLVMPVVANRRQTRKICKKLGIWDEMIKAGMVDVSPYDPANIEYINCNAGDPMSFSFTLNSRLADLLEGAFAKKPASQWEKELCEVGIPCVKVLSFKEWMNDKEARAAGVIAQVNGHKHVQIGRSAWIASAQPYPEIYACKQVNFVPERNVPLPSANQQQPKNRPLEGFTLVDFSNVLAGPNCGRMFSELGATVYKIDPMDPQHSPLAMIIFSAEAGVGKRSIILNMNTDEGKEIMNKIVSGADMILANKVDTQFERMGLDRKSLDNLNPNIIGIQISAHRGEKTSSRHNYPGYDPAAQAITGIANRFGQKGSPTPHGLASCVDYLCGCLGAWAGVTALVARERHQKGQGDWAESSLVAAGTLVQLLLQQTPEPESARGAYATGMNESERVYKLTDGWIFAQGDNDLTGELSSFSVEEALEYLKEKGISAVPVQTCKELADRHRKNPSKSVIFGKNERDGWETEKFFPTWFVFDGEQVECPGAAARVGSDAAEILDELGYSSNDINHLIASGVVGKTEWVP